MKVYIQTETHQADGTADVRPRVLLLETAADAKPALALIAPGLGTIVATPAAMHESNLKALLVRDLAAAGVLPGSPEDGDEVLLKVIRHPHDEVWHLTYAIS